MKSEIKLSVLSLTALLNLQGTFAAEDQSHERLNKTIEQLSALSLNDQIDAIANDSALSSYQMINQNWTYIKIPADFRTDSTSWEAKETTVKTELDVTNISYFLWNHITQPCLPEALKNILCSSTRTECVNAFRIVKLQILSNILGNEKMNVLIATLNSKGKKTETYDFISTLSWSFQSQCEENYQGVYFMSFVNIPWYPKYKPTGNAGNHNVIKLADGRFIGFDPIFFSQPRTYDELERHMYEEFISNQDVVGHNKEEFARFCQVLEEDGGFESFKRLRRQYQSVNKPFRFDVSKIVTFIKTGTL